MGFQVGLETYRELQIFFLMNDSSIQFYLEISIFLEKNPISHFFFAALTTEDKLEYQWYPISGSQIQFRIKAPHDAHIALTTGPYESEPIWEV